MILVFYTSISYVVNDFLIYESTPGDFESISDRWDSFVEAHKVIFSHLNDEKKRDNFCVKNNIQKSELGELHTTVFNLMKIALSVLPRKIVGVS